HNFYALDLKTSQVTQLTNLDADKLNPNTISISRDEQQIAYVTFENDQYVISTMPVRGSAAKPIVRSANEIRNLAWHPDNRRIFYSALVSGVFQIFVIDIEASQPVQLTFADRDNLVLDVSEDGTKILYGSSKEEADVWSVQVANGDETSLAADINSELWADVSPDGKVVAYQSINNLSQGNKLFSGAIVTRPITPNAQPLQLISNGFLPLWSPDGTQLAFMRVSGETYNLWSIKADGGAEKQLTLNGMFSVGFSVLPYNRMQTSDFSWSPDGKKIAYMPKQGNAQNIYLVDTTDSVSVPLTNNTNANLSVFCPLWSSDGKRLAYSSSLSAVADKGSVYTVSVIDVESKNTKSFTQPWPVQRLLGWSHTGRELILAALNTQARTTSPAEVELVQVDCETGAQRQLARLEAAYFFNIHLSKDKKTIAYVSHRDDKDNVWVRRLEGSEERKLTSNVDPRLYYSSLSWSSDSRAIYFGKQKRYSLLSMISNFK
ncbi:MAG TPA: hypothetical protein VEF04_02100, partial [Blastocatellia bacterium]|nr:hypothetical protein [Blastocatellia bacterium]